MISAIKRNISVRIRKLLPESLKLPLRRLQVLMYSSHEPEYAQYANIESRKIFVFVAGFYQNLGDLAIVYAQARFLEQTCPESKVIVVPCYDTYKSIRTIKKIIRPSDLITVVGGGNMCDIYSSLENERLLVVENFPHHKIVSFPQTVFFSDNDRGRKRQDISRRIYERHKNLKIFVREQNSFEITKKAFPRVTVGLCPDIVLSLNMTEPQSERTEVVCCMRGDTEQRMTKEEKDNLKTLIRDRFPNAVFTDTVKVPAEDCTPERYEQLLDQFWNLLRQSKLVVTDRLHCMLFCVITGTPCIALDTTNRKISGTCNVWLKGVDSVMLLQSYEPAQLKQAMDLMLSFEYKCTQINFTEMFDSLKKACLYIQRG